MRPIPEHSRNVRLQSPRRIRERVLDHNLTLPPRGRFVVQSCPGLQLSDPQHVDWLKKTIEQEKYEVVVIDTYQRATTGMVSFDDAQQSPILHDLADLTCRLGVTIIIIDHLRKSSDRRGSRKITIDDIKGTSAKAQNADCIILMERSGQEIKFRVSSKDTDKQVAFSLRVREKGGSGPKFEYLGALEMPGRPRRCRPR